jgi:hypothetical protein
VLQVQEDQVEVFFVDYGNKSTLSLHRDLRTLDNMQLMELQTLAIPCSLRGSVTTCGEKETSELLQFLEKDSFIVRLI